MPSFTFQCKNCNYRHEEFVKHTEVDEKGGRAEWKEWFHCNNYCCEPGDMLAVMSAPAILGGDKVHKYGINGVFNRGLGEYVYSDADLRKKAAAKGLVLASDAGISNWGERVDTQFHQDIKQATDHEKAVSKIKDGLDSHGDEGRALAEAFSVDVMKDSGNLKENYDAAE